MQNNFIPDAIDTVSKAIAADNEGDYDKALSFYRDALSRFTLGLKYEKNESRKKLILQRVEGYMKRAEELRDYLNKQHIKFQCFARAHAGDSPLCPRLQCPAMWRWSFAQTL